MVKKIVLSVLVMLPLVAFAQDKIAYLNYENVVVAMPEFKLMEDSLKKAATEFQAELKDISDEFNKKYVAYISQRDSLNESIRLRREQEIQEIDQRAQNFQQYAQQKQEETQQNLFIPIQNKLQKAIEDVGRENNFLYIANSQTFLYTSPGAIDATPLVKKKLGIQ